MSNTRRELLVQIAAAAAVAGSVDEAAAQHVHHAAQQVKAAGPYVPKAFTPAETETLRALCELIVPGAAQGGAFEFIDLLCSNNAELKAIYTGGLAWLDRQMERRAGAPFVQAKPADQTALLDLIAYRKNAAGELGPGVRFFDWARRMTVDAYFTSPAGVKELDYRGNRGMTTFQVPQAAIDYALKRSKLG
jgi:hypothetical protein